MPAYSISILTWNTYTGRAVVEHSTHDPKTEGSGRHDTQHTNIQQNDTEHKGPNSDRHSA